jgi:cell division protein FtsI/penicillin-binding protein 2
VGCQATHRPAVADSPSDHPDSQALTHLAPAPARSCAFTFRPVVIARACDVLAAASRQGAGTRRWTVVTDPYEPGSTIKPFVVAALLAEDRATLADSLDAGGGSYRQGRRTITDVHGYGWLTLGDALRHSSNVAVIRAAERLEPAEQYGYLRDFGFGSPTGVRYP